MRGVVLALDRNEALTGTRRSSQPPAENRFSRIQDEDIALMLHAGATLNLNANMDFQRRRSAEFDYGVSVISPGRVQVPRAGSEDQIPDFAAPDVLIVDHGTRPTGGCHYKREEESLVDIIGCRS